VGVGGASFSTVKPFKKGNLKGHLIQADKIYRNRENLRYCKEKQIAITGPAIEE